MMMSSSVKGRKLTNSISIFGNPALNFESYNSDGDDFLSGYNVGSIQFTEKGLTS